MSYYALCLALLGTAFLLVVISDRLEFLYFTNSKGEEIPIMKYLVLFGTGWLSLAIINVAIKINELESYDLGATVAVFYKSVMWLMIFISAIWLIGFLFDVYEKIANMGDSK